MAEVLRQIPISTDPRLLVGLDTRDDAGIFVLSEDLALVQTVDFFTPVVDDPYAFGQIAAANALSDVYAMGGQPLTALNIACFDPDVIPGDVWAQVLLGAHDKTIEAGAVLLGGHSVIDSIPKFGMAVTGTVHPQKVFSNSAAQVGDSIYLSKPLGTGVIVTAAKSDSCPPNVLEEAIKVMLGLNRDAAMAGKNAGVVCATDITGFGLAGHLWNVAEASGVTIRLKAEALPVLEGALELLEHGVWTTGASNNGAYMEGRVRLDATRNNHRIILDPQTSGGLALFSKHPLPYPKIGEVMEGPSSIVVD